MLSTVAGLQSTPSEIIELSRSLVASRIMTFVKVRALGPAAILHRAETGHLAGLCRGGGGGVHRRRARGIGYVIVSSKSQIQTELAFAGIFLLSLMSVLSYYLLVVLERRLVPWAKETTS